MIKTYSIKGMMCKGCKRHIKEQLEKHPNVKQVDISRLTLVDVARRRKDAVISLIQHTTIAELQRFIDLDTEYAGRYFISLQSA